MQDRNPLNTSDYLSETIKSRPLNKKRLLKRAIEVVAFAVLFGFIAYITITLASRSLTEKLFPRPINEVVFTEDNNEPIMDEVEPEEMLLQGDAGTNAIPPGEAHLMETANSLQEIAKSCASWMVLVTGVTTETSWLDSTATSEKVSAGAIIADNGTEYLVLVRNRSLEGASRIEVQFVDESKLDATIKGIDKNLGFTVVAVPKYQLPEKTRKKLSVVEMSNSNNKSLLGDPVIALGSPNGIQGSVCYGYLTAMNVDVNEWDYNYHLLATDIYGSTNPNGFLVNTKGQLIGLLCNTYNGEDTKNLVSAIGISEMKKRIEQTSNGKDIPLLGIKGTEVAAEAKEKQGVPAGAYITSVKWDSPAMTAGLQPGDVIVKMDDKDVASMYYLSYLLLQKEVTEEIELVIMRPSQGEYKERVLKLTLVGQ